MSKLIFALIAAGMVFAGMAVSVSAHVHTVANPHHVQDLANGQNHPGFVDDVSCEGIAEPADAGPSGYGLETAHHGPDSGTPGQADGCYEKDPGPDDQNPAID